MAFCVGVAMSSMNLLTPPRYCFNDIAMAEESYTLGPELEKQLPRPEQEGALKLLRKHGVYTTEHWIKYGDSKLRDECGALLRSHLDKLSGIKPRGVPGAFDAPQAAGASDRVRVLGRVRWFALLMR